MANLIKATTYVLGDEPALALVETNQLVPHKDGKAGTGWYRFQVIRVWRDDALWEYKERLGKAKSFKGDPILILGGFIYKDKNYFEHTVNELKEMADEMREIVWDKSDLAQVDRTKS